MSWWQWFVSSIGVVLLVYAGVVAALVVAGRRADARALAAFVADCIVRVSRLVRDPRVTRRRRLLLLALVGDLALPFDLVPDFRSLDGLIRELWPGPQRLLGVILGLAS